VIKVYSEQKNMHATQKRTCQNHQKESPNISKSCFRLKALFLTASQARQYLISLKAIGKRRKMNFPVNRSQIAARLLPKRRILFALVIRYAPFFSKRLKHITGLLCLINLVSRHAVSADFLSLATRKGDKSNGETS
jgi:hypothetical protein